MTQQEYEQAHAGLIARPERHFIIDLRTHYSLGQLEEARVKAGLLKIEDAAGRIIHKPKAPVQTPAKAEVAPKAEKPAKQPEQAPEAKKPAKQAGEAPPVQKSSAVPEGVHIPSEIPEGVEIPDVLGALGFNDLKSLASKLGIKPVPNNTGALISAIEAVRSAAAQG